MIAGFCPFTDTDVEKIFKNIQKNELKIPEFFSDNAKDLVTQLLERNPK